MTRPVAQTTRRWRSVLIPIALAMFACDEPTEPDYIPLVERELAVSPTGVALSGIDATASFALVDSTDAPVPADSVTWFSWAPAIATVDAATGVVTAVAAGQAVVGARIDTVDVGYGVVTVSAPGPPLQSWVADTLARPDLNAVWGRADDDIFVVGEQQLIYHYDGTRWRRQYGGRTTVDPSELVDVAGTASGAAFAVGHRRDSFRAPVGILRYEAGRWTTEQADGRDFMSVAAVSSTNFVAVDEYGMAYRFDGSTWHSMGGGVGSGESVVWGSSPTDVFVGGEGGRISHFDGADWTAMERWTDYEIGSLWGTRPDNVYAGGDGIRHYDGDGWSELDTGLWAGAIQAITGYSADDVWGTGSVVLNGGWRQAVFHYDGSEWSAEPNEELLGVYVHINDLWMSPSGSVYGVVADGALVTRRDGAWTLKHIGAGPEQVKGLWGNNSEEVYRVGIGRELEFGNRAAGWVDPCRLAIDSVADVWAASEQDVVAVGAKGEALRLADGYCTKGSVVEAQTGSLAAVWGASPNDVWAVGAPDAYWQPPVLFHFNGATWQSVTAAFPNGKPYFADLWGLASDAIWAVGRVDSIGGVWHYNGTGWFGQVVPEGGPLTSVWGPDPANLFAVGTGGRILHYDGADWAAMVSPDTADLNAVWGMAPTDIYAAGDGVVLHYDGTSWTRIGGAPDTYYTAIWGSSIGPVYFGAEGQFITANR